ncbi:MAG: hypothetical protein BA867_02550 [Desulfobacterales bacterium S5133MH16]|nr:MAG: hypothetical protein BA867_02550 [Desulfobacterales bacterium S5133MH16]
MKNAYELEISKYISNRLISLAGFDNGKIYSLFTNHKLLRLPFQNYNLVGLKADVDLSFNFPAIMHLPNFPFFAHSELKHTDASHLVDQRYAYTTFKRRYYYFIFF